MLKRLHNLNLSKNQTTQDYENVTVGNGFYVQHKSERSR